MTTRPPVPQEMLDNTTLIESGTHFHRDVYGDWHRLHYHHVAGKYYWFSIGGAGSIVPDLLERIYQLEHGSDFEVNT
jgi:hypothetical protein